MQKKATFSLFFFLLLWLSAQAQSPMSGKTDVWDFSAEQLDPNDYNNQLTEAIINSWYDVSITVGSSGNVLPNFTAGDLSWTGGSNDRLRTTNLNLTRFDQNIGGVNGYAGRLYVNSGANITRYLSLMLAEDDAVTIVAKTDAGGTINFEYVADPNLQKDATPITSDLTDLKFVAKNAGEYRVFDTQGKPSYFRVSRKSANYIAVAGTVDETMATGIPATYDLVFTNAAGKAWTVPVSGGTFTANLPSGYSYTLSLSGTSGFVIGSGETLHVDDNTSTHAIQVLKLDLFTVSGSISGLGANINNLVLTYTPDPAANSIYVPNPVVDAGAGTYTVKLEPNVEYTISAEGVNDFFIPANTLTIGNANTSADVDFSAKPLYTITIFPSGLSPDQLAALNLNFENLHEAGYNYSFPSGTSVELRDGTYGISARGLDVYPVALKLSSNLKVAGAATSKSLDFAPVTNWSFDDKVITNGDPAYKGMLFTGQVSNEVLKGHLVAKDGATIQVPVNPGDKVNVSYYYTADFSIEGGPAITTNSQSTTQFEHAAYNYAGANPGYVTLTVGTGASTTYFTNISVVQPLPYKAVITVGQNKDYQIINEALAAIRRMERNADDRVTILVDPGNYEEMLLIDAPNVTLKNAAASPNIDLLNNGVDIASGAVRVTGYYGHGYSYYSMGNNQKWDAEVLAVNKENGYLSYDNKGAGTTNGSYWNATVVVMADGFVAESIIFENSFNQYISAKEVDDVVVEWPVGGKGPRPVVAGSTAVQNRSFVERAAAIAVANNTDKVILNKCRVVGRQDALFGGSNARVVMYKGVSMGAVDYIFGGMTAVFYKTDLAMNTSDVSTDQAYITAAQQGAGRGYLMYACKVTTAIPGLETASQYRAKPGYFGRPWQANTSEVVFYNTLIETSNFPGSENLSLIVPLGWQNTLGGESSMMYEYGTTEVSGIDNSGARAAWSTILSQPTLTDGTDITTFNFTKGNDGWDPLPGLISMDQVSTHQPMPETAVLVHSSNHQVFVTNVQSNTRINVYNVNGNLVRSLESNSDFKFEIPENGFWIVCVSAADGKKAVKLITH